ncbi:unnamed protein product [Phytomonas sp. EM1]|nr:unnamed protein product [Phytomonas sp. EM1]|eukprot:CCW60645.1 unnamed protein product [Phytomonas sp. isolate EM1]
MQHAPTWDQERQVVLVQLHHIILALRSGLKFGSKGRYASGDKVHEHPLLYSAMELRKRLLSCTQMSHLDWAPSYHPLGTHSLNRGDSKRHEVGESGNLHLPQADVRDFFSTATKSARRSSFSRIHELTESEILSPFCEVCRCPDIGEPIIIVALSAIDTILDFSRSIITEKGVKLAIEAALSVRSKASDPAAHEVLLARTVQVCVTCMRHPAAVELPEDLYIRIVRRTLVISFRSEATPLLKRVAEGFMSFLVTCLYSRVVDRQKAYARIALESASYRHQSFTQGLTTGGEATSSRMKIFSTHDGSFTFTPLAVPPLDGASMMRYISSLISTEVTLLDAEGNMVSNDDSLEKARSSGFTVVSDQNNPTIQLEGLSLAQAALLTIQEHLSDSCSAELLSVVQNNLCRALLVAAMSTTHVVVFALVLRIIHIVVESAAHVLTPQIFNFLRFIHLNPIIAPTARMDRVNSSQSNSIRANPTNSTRSATTLLPLNARVHRSFVSDTLLDDIPYSRPNNPLECREILLESLAEFCSNPSFCSFCFLHYDLSWRCHSLLPQLCDVLVESACPSAMGINSNMSQSVLLNDNSMQVHPRPNNGKVRVKDDDSDDKGVDILPISRIELVALDAATSMVSNFASRSSESPYSIPQDTSDRCNIVTSWKATVENMITQKSLLLKFAALFEESPLKKGIPFLLENSIRLKADEGKRDAESHRFSLVLAEPAGGYEIGQCLYRLSHLLNKNVLGNYIGELGTERVPKPPEDQVVILPDGTFTTAVEEWEKSRSEDHLQPGTVCFFRRQLEGFVGEFNFDNKSLLTSIRELVYHLCLPGESQKIDRVIEVFAKHWYLHNVNSEKHINPFSSESGAFVLSFAIIMLNTDLHSGKIQKSMTQSDFKNINRSIDNGNSLPDEYLFTIYNDVKRHELVMAETVNRDFANKVTWDLEISRFSSECEDNFAIYYISNAIKQSEGGGVQPHSIHASSAPTPTCSLRDEKILSELDPYAFNVIQSRCFLIFKHLLAKSCAQVMRLNPRGSTLKDALDDAHSILPKATSALLSSIRGIRMLSCSATALGMHEISDECIMTLSSYVRVNFSEGMDAVDDLYRNLPTLILIKEIFSLLFWTTPSLQNSCSVVGNLLLNLYFLGMLAVETDPGECYRCLAETVFRPPDFAVLHGLDPSRSQTQTKKSVGWLAALWGSAFNSSENEDPQGEGPSSSPALGLQLEARVRECVPNMEDILRVICNLPIAARERLLRVLMGVDCGSASPGHFRGMKSNSLSVCCYRLSFVTACVAATTSYPEMAELFDSYLGYLQSVLNVYFAAGDGRGRMDPDLDDRDASTHQLSSGKKTSVTAPSIDEKVMRETVSTVLKILQSIYFRRNSIAISATIVPRISRVFLSVPKPAFNDFVALPLVKFLSLWIIDMVLDKAEPCLRNSYIQNNSNPSLTLKSYVSMVVGFLVDIVARLDVPAFDPSVLTEIGTILLRFAKIVMYDVASETEVFLKLALSLEILDREQRHRRQSQGLFSADSTSAHRVERDLGEFQRSSSSPASSEENMFAEILGLCCGNVVRLRKVLTSSFVNTHHRAEEGLRKTSEDSKTSPQSSVNWQQLWILSLQSLSSLILSSPMGSRSRRSAMLALQHAVLDMEPGTLDAATIGSAYEMVLFPLTETVCASSSTLAASTAVSPELCAADPSHAPAIQYSSGASGVWVASLQQLVLPPLSVKVRPASVEDKSCIINILSKVFLHHMPILEGMPEILWALWQSILSTLYAVYTASLAVQDEVLNENDKVSLPRNKCVETEYLMEEASLLQMAVEETVKNMIYVVASSGGNVLSLTLSGQASSFPAFTRSLISPFPFSGPLLEFLDNI